MTAPAVVFSDRELDIANMSAIGATEHLEPPHPGPRYPRMEEYARKVGLSVEWLEALANAAYRRALEVGL